MPRRARWDAPGTLHHVIVRGIEKRGIVNDVADRKNFVNRLGELSAGTKTSVYAWALMTNHRILGSGAFVERIIKEAEANIKYQLPVKKDDQKLDEYIAQICESKNVSIQELKMGSRCREVSRVQAQVATGLSKRHGFSLAEVASRRVGVSTSAIAKILNRESQ